MRSSCLMRFQMLVERAFIAQRLPAYVTDVLNAIVGLPNVNLLVTFEAVVRSEGGVAQVALELFQAAVALNVVFE